MHSKTKHIPIKYPFLRDQVSQKAVKLEYVDTGEQIVDIFTKPLPKEAFDYLRKNMWVISLNWIKRRKNSMSGGVVRQKPLSSLSNGENDLMFPSMPKGENVEWNFHWCQKQFSNEIGISDDTMERQAMEYVMRMERHMRGSSEGIKSNQTKLIDQSFD